MSLFKYIDCVKSIHSLIEAEKTGTSDEFAEQLRVSRSLLMEHLREIRETYHAPIDYCRKRKTFYYKTPFQLKIEITTEMGSIKGGAESLTNSIESEGTGLYCPIFDLQTFIS
jgi:hypothetical protein